MIVVPVDDGDGVGTMPAGVGTVTFCPHDLQGPDCPANCSPTWVVAPQYGQVNEMAMLHSPSKTPVVGDACQFTTHGRY